MDGYRDILLGTRLISNNGNNQFSDDPKISFYLNGNYGPAGCYDFDNSGYPDLLYNGYSFNDCSNNHRIVINNSNNTFNISKTIRSNFPITSTGGDYNNDGLIDIISGNKLFKNENNVTFSEQQKNSISPIINGSSNFIDFNNDGLLDVFLCGSIYSDYPTVTMLYKNMGEFQSNILPSTPTGLSSSYGSHFVNLIWDEASDNETPKEALTYNIRIGTTPGGIDIINPLSSLSNGFRRISKPGNTGSKNIFNISNLPNGKYYWSVQSIDNSLAGSFWAPEKSFEIKINPIKDPLYPNPARSYTFFKNIKGIKSYSIYDTNGRIIQRQINISEEHIINLENLKSGLYIFKIELTDYQIYTKLIIE